MLPAPLTRKPRGIAWMVVSFALVMAWALTVPAQSGPKDQPSAKGGDTGSSSKSKPSGPAKDAGKNKGKDEDKKGGDEDQGKEKGKEKAKDKGEAAEPSKAPKTELEERFVDPRITDEMVAKDYKQLFPNEKPWTKADQDQLTSLIEGNQLNRDLIKHLVRSSASDLTNKRYVAAVRDDGGNRTESEQFRQAADVELFEQAAVRMLKVYDAANERNNPPLRDELTNDLIDRTVGPELLKNNIYARNQFMIVLSRSRDPKALRTFVSQLNDRDQMLSVKLTAAVGIMNLAQHVDLAPGDAISAAKALSGFLANEKDAFWPIQYRALQALGWLRQSTERPNAGEAEFAETAMGLLSDPEKHLLVRASAAWALGMMPPPPSAAAKYNLPLIASQAGYLAAQIGDRIVDVYPKDPKRQTKDYIGEALKLTDALLLIAQSFRTDPQLGPRNGGIQNMGVAAPAADLAMVREVETRIKAVAKAAIDLEDAVSRFKELRRFELFQRAKDLVDYLDEHKPQDLALVPNGAPYALPEVKLVKRQPPQPAAKKASTQAKATSTGRSR